MDPPPFSSLLRSFLLWKDWQQGHYTEVAIRLQERIQSGIEDEDLYWCLGSVYWILGQELEAQLTWQEGVSLGGAEPEAARRLAKVLQEMGEDLWERGHWPQAAALYRQLWELGEAFPVPELSSWQVLAAHRIGLLQGRCRLWQEASFWFEQACHRDPTAAEVFLQWGLALIKLGQLKEAIEPLQRAAHLQPDRAEPWVQLGVVWLDLRDPQQAIACFQAAAARDPLAKGLYSYWVEALIRLERPDAALEMLGQAVGAEQEWLRAWGAAAADREQEMDPLQGALLSLLKLELTGADPGSRRHELWSEIYSAWRQRLIPSSEKAPAPQG
ncbi:MAG: tetratricopeptide repeat protein, partial [Thermostichus sp. HHBFW_bins_43]